MLEFEGDSPDYRVKRGLAHILKGKFCTIEIVSPLDPPELRQRVFTLAAASIPTPQRTPAILEQVADELSREGSREVSVDSVRRGLYADLQENRILTEFDTPEPDAILHRYNLSQVQGIFYRASHITINAHRNVPGGSTSCYSAI